MAAIHTTNLWPVIEARQGMFRQSYTVANYVVVCPELWARFLGHPLLLAITVALICMALKSKLHKDFAWFSKYVRHDCSPHCFQISLEHSQVASRTG